MVADTGRWCGRDEERDRKHILVYILINLSALQTLNDPELIVVVAGRSSKSAALCCLRKVGEICTN